MFDHAVPSVKFNLNPLPVHRISYFRLFEDDEHHMERVCPHFVFLFVLKNTLYFEENGVPVEVHEGEWYLQLPGLLQTGTKASPGVEYFFIHFTSEYAPYSPEQEMLVGTAQPLYDTEQIVLPVRGRFDISMLADFRHLHKLRDTPNKILETQADFLAILEKVYESTFLSAMEDNTLSNAVLDFILESYPLVLTAKDFEEKFSYTYDYICKIFKKKYGSTPMQHCRSMRNKHACDLLEYTNKTLTAISQDVGYSNELLFYKAFKKENGISPGNWRKNHRANSL